VLSNDEVAPNGLTALRQTIYLLLLYFTAICRMTLYGTIAQTAAMVPGVQNSPAHQHGSHTSSCSDRQNSCDRISIYSERGKAVSRFAFYT